jgi:Protein of unknown function (DUF732)
MKKSMVPLMMIVVGIAFAPTAAADDQGYLEELSSVGMPVSDDNRDVLIQLGQQACVTAHEDPSMKADDLAMQIAEARSAYPFDRARLVVSSALHNYCSDATATPAG